ncbi:hypothetical protein ACFL0U_02060 [Pseudomonadota bacterium]
MEKEEQIVPFKGKKLSKEERKKLLKCRKVIMGAPALHTNVVVNEEGEITYIYKYKSDVELTTEEYGKYLKEYGEDFIIEMHDYIITFFHGEEVFDVEVSPSIGFSQSFKEEEKNILTAIA